MTDGGTYTLLIELAAAADVTFGAAGVRELEPGPLAYTGSALGPGGFARVERHRAVVAGERAARHWHIDALLGESASRLVDVVRSPGLAAECAVAGAIAEAPGVEAVPGVGATDCGCSSHLAAGADAPGLVEVVRRAHRAVSG